MKSQVQIMFQSHNYKYEVRSGQSVFNMLKIIHSKIDDDERNLQPKLYIKARNINHDVCNIKCMLKTDIIVRKTMHKV